MAGKIGPYLRRLRLNQGLTQRELYQELLSERQSIRFEAGRNDIQAERLFAVLARMALPITALTPLMPASTRDPVLQSGLTKLSQWPDATLTPEENRALTTYVTGQSPLTLADIQTVTPLLGRFDEALSKRLYQSTWRHLQAHQSEPEYSSLASSFCIGALYYALFHADLTMAQSYLERWLKAAPQTIEQQIQRNFFAALIKALPAGAAACYQATATIIHGLRAIGIAAMADALVDNRRHILSAFGLHLAWRRDELGALARSTQRHQATVVIATYPGLAAALSGQPLTTFRAIIE